MFPVLPRTRNSSKNLSEIKPIRSSSIIVEGITNDLHVKYEKTTCKHCLNPAKTIETKKFIKPRLEKLKFEKRPKNVRKPSIGSSSKLPTPLKKSATAVLKVRNKVFEYKTPQKNGSPAVQDIGDGLCEPFLEMKRKKHPEVEVLFDSKRDIIKPYHMDGDPKMYSADVLAKRKCLKSDEDIKKAIFDFMQLYKFDKNNCLSRYQYMQTQLKIACILRPELKSYNQHQDLRKLLEQDWKHDSQGLGEMNKEQLEKSLFEMVDIWTTGIEKEQYISFFGVLKMKFIFEEEENQKLFAELYQA